MLCATARRCMRSASCKADSDITSLFGIQKVYEGLEFFSPSRTDESLAKIIMHPRFSAISL